MAAARLLQKDTRCDCCGELMKAGEPFRWHLRAGRQVTKYTATKDRYRPAHVNEACYIEKVRARDAELDREQMAKTRAMLLEAFGPNAPPEVLAMIEKATAANHASFKKE